MAREEQICKQSVKYVKETHSPNSVSESQTAINISAIKAFTAGAKWADKTILQEVLEWLNENFYDVHVLHDDRLEGGFNNKEQMFQAFKEQFNIE